MPKLSFQTLAFHEREDYLEVRLLNLFLTKISLSELGALKVKDAHTLDLSAQQEKKFPLLLSKYFCQLKNTLNGHQAIYIHQNSGIPLLGSGEFGIVYRNSSLIELKPFTSCNLNCIYCSVGEGRDSKKIDFVVEKDYLVNELQKLLDFVNEPVEVHIGVQGEPLLYADVVPLIADLQKNKKITFISMDTNFTLATPQLLDEFSKFSKLRLNISLDALDEKLAAELSGGAYNLKHILEMIKLAVKKGIRVLIAPVLVPGYNEEEMEKIVQFVKELDQKDKKNHPLIGIQNFLNYKTGRNPAKAWTWEKFNQFIQELEEKTKIKLRLNEKDFGIHPVKELPKPLVIDEIVKAVIKAPDRFPRSCLAVAKERTISVPECEFRMNKEIKVKITRDKHNIFAGKVV